MSGSSHRTNSWSALCYDAKSRHLWNNSSSKLIALKRRPVVQWLPMPKPTAWISYRTTVYNALCTLIYRATLRATTRNIRACETVRAKSFSRSNSGTTITRRCLTIDSGVLGYTLYVHMSRVIFDPVSYWLSNIKSYCFENLTEEQLHGVSPLLIQP